MEEIDNYGYISVVTDYHCTKYNRARNFKIYNHLNECNCESLCREHRVLQNKQQIQENHIEVSTEVA